MGESYMHGILPERELYAQAPENCSDYFTAGVNYKIMTDAHGRQFMIDDGGCSVYIGAAFDWDTIYSVPERDINDAPIPICAGNVASGKQVGGDHYLKMKIQPLEFCMANELDACQTKIIKYICRNKSSQIEDLEKARHVLDYYIDWVKSNV